MIRTHCTLCRRPCVVRPTPRITRISLPVCVRCQRTTVRTAVQDRLGARTFYVHSFSPDPPPVPYVVKAMGRKITCTCPNYVHVGQVLAVPCKHTRLVRCLGRAYGGVYKVPAGTTFTIDLRQTRRRRTGAVR